MSTQIAVEVKLGSKHCKCFLEANSTNDIYSGIEVIGVITNNALGIVLMRVADFLSSHLSKRSQDKWMS